MQGYGGIVGGTHFVPHDKKAKRLRNEGFPYDLDTAIEKVPVKCDMQR